MVHNKIIFRSVSSKILAFFSQQNRSFRLVSRFLNQIFLTRSIISEEFRAQKSPRRAQRFTRGRLIPAIFESLVSAERLVSLHPSLKVFPCCSHRSFKLITRTRSLSWGKRRRRARPWGHGYLQVNQPAEPTFPTIFRNKTFEFNLVTVCRNIFWGF